MLYLTPSDSHKRTAKNLSLFGVEKSGKISMGHDLGSKVINKLLTLKERIGRYPEPQATKLFINVLKCTQTLQ